MCGCGTTTWCDGGCPCGCDHDTPTGMRRQGKHFARLVQLRPVKCSDCDITFSSHPDFLNHLTAIDRHNNRKCRITVETTGSMIGRRHCHTHDVKWEGAFAVGGGCPATDTKTNDKENDHGPSGH